MHQRMTSLMFADIEHAPAAPTMGASPSQDTSCCLADAAASTVRHLFSTACHCSCACRCEAGNLCRQDDRLLRWYLVGPVMITVRPVASPPTSSTPGTPRNFKRCEQESRC